MSKEFVYCYNQLTSINKAPSAGKEYECGSFHMITGNVIIRFDCIAETSTTYFLMVGRESVGLIRGHEWSVVELARNQGVRIIKAATDD